MAFLLYHNFIKYMPRTNEINNGMNSSSALVAPQRSEIRILSSVVFPTISHSTQRMLHRAAMMLTPAICAVLAICYMLQVSMPSWLVGSMVISASVGFVYGFFHIMAMAVGHIQVRTQHIHYQDLRSIQRCTVTVTISRNLIKPQV